MSVNTMYATHYKLGRAHKVSYSGTAGLMSSNIGDQIEDVILTATTNCYFKIGSAADLAASPATSADYELFTGTYFPVRLAPGQRISFVQETSSGVATVIECSL